MNGLTWRDWLGLAKWAGLIYVCMVGLAFTIVAIIQRVRENHYHCDHCDRMLPLEGGVDPDSVTMCPDCQAAGHQGGICTPCVMKEPLESAAEMHIRHAREILALQKDHFRPLPLWRRLLRLITRVG